MSQIIFQTYFCNFFSYRFWTMALVECTSHMLTGLYVSRSNINIWKQLYALKTLISNNIFNINSARKNLKKMACTMISKYVLGE